MLIWQACIRNLLYARARLEAENTETNEIQREATLWRDRTDTNVNRVWGPCIPQERNQGELPEKLLDKFYEPNAATQGRQHRGKEGPLNRLGEGLCLIGCWTIGYGQRGPA